MNAEELIQFVDQKMSMRRVYQPLLIRPLVDAGGSATLRQAAVALVSEDEALISEAERTLLRMPIAVLRRPRVLEHDKTTKLIRLAVPPLTLEERARGRMPCDQRLGSYLAARGMSIWDYIAAHVAGNLKQ